MMAVHEMAGDGNQQLYFVMVVSRWYLLMPENGDG